MIVILAFISFLEAAQLLIAIAFILQFIPIPASSFVQTLFPLSMYDVRPEREMALYRFAIVAAIGIQVSLMYFFRRRRDDTRVKKDLYAFAAVLACWVFVQVFAVFKMLLWGNTCWKMLLGVALLGGIFSTIFWPELKKFGVKTLGRLSQGSLLPRPWVGDVIVAGVLVILLWPDLTAVLARMFVNDQFYHLDSI